MSAAPPLDAQQIRSRAVSGVVTVALRNIGVRLIGLAGTIVLARLLAPADYGILALGLTIKMLGGVVASGGLGAALIRRATPPERAELEAVQGFQLAGTLAVLAGVAVAGAVAGGALAVAAVTVLSLPIATASAPSRIVLERQLDWKLLSRVEIGSTVVYQVAAVGLVVAGLGVWGVAAAAVIEAVVTLGVLVAFGPIGPTRPRLALAPLRPLLRFGVQAQGISLVTTGRDQGLNSLIAAIGGVAVLGVWSLVFRLLQAVTLFLSALQRVAYPSLARALAAGEDAAWMVNRSMRLNAIALGLPAVALAASAPALVPALLGDQWLRAADVLPWGAAAVLVSAPVTSVGIPFLQASGDGGASLRVVVVQAVTVIAAAAALVPSLGAVGAGVAMLVGAVALAGSVGRATRRHAAVRTFAAVGPVDLCAVAAAVPGWFVARELGPPVAGLVASVALSLVVFGALLLAFRRGDVLTLVRLLRRGAGRSPG